MTARRFAGDRLVIASHNPGKVGEIAALLRPYVAHFVGATDVGLPEPEETGLTFIENAELKARLAAEASGTPALADDSGLAVTALRGSPGIYSARWAGPDRDWMLAMERVHREMEGSDDRSAAFICALSLAWPDGHCETVEGRVEGAIAWPPRGDKGFGYDPIFVPTGHDVTFAEMNPAAKHAISHRADAFAQLVARCFAGG